MAGRVARRFEALDGIAIEMRAEFVAMPLEVDRLGHERVLVVGDIDRVPHPAEQVRLVLPRRRTTATRAASSSAASGPPAASIAFTSTGSAFSPRSSMRRRRKLALNADGRADRPQSLAGKQHVDEIRDQRRGAGRPKPSSPTSGVVSRSLRSAMALTSHRAGDGDHLDLRHRFERQPSAEPADAAARA